MNAGEETKGPPQAVEMVFVIEAGGRIAVFLGCCGHWQAAHALLDDPMPCVLMGNTIWIQWGIKVEDIWEVEGEMQGVDMIIIYWIHVEILKE